MSIIFNSITVLKYFWLNKCSLGKQKKTYFKNIEKHNYSIFFDQQSISFTLIPLYEPFKIFQKRYIYYMYNFILTIQFCDKAAACIALLFVFTSSP